jgi:IMP dehydrogenase
MKLVFNEVVKTIHKPIDGTCLNDLTVEDDHSYCVGPQSMIVHNCLTTQQTGVGYPMASLIHECAQFAAQMDISAKIVADGGFNKYADIIKALALGADYVMLGGLLSKMIESDSVPYLWKLFPIKNRRVAQWLYEVKAPLYKRFRGMSTKEVQRDWQKTNSEKPVELKTSEGIVKWNRVENSLLSWVENFEAYLRSAMSYSNARDLQEFRENSSFVQVTAQSQARFRK